MEWKEEVTLKVPIKEYELLYRLYISARYINKNIELFEETYEELKKYYEEVEENKEEKGGD